MTAARRRAWPLVRRAAAAWPAPVATPASLDRALGLLGVPVDDDAFARASRTLGACAFLVAFGSVALAVSPAYGLPVGLAAASAVAYGLPRVPVAVAALRRTRALGAAADLVCRASLRLRVDPTPERAARFAARTGDGALAASLDDHVRRAAAAPEAGFRGFAAEWAPWFPPLTRATDRLVAAADADADDRERALDRALDAVLDGVQSQQAAFAADVRGPAVGVYAFGVLLPLALVGLLPAVGAAGVALPPAALALGYDVGLPLALLVATAWLLTRRPVAFPPPRIPASHPDVPAGRWRWVGAAALAGGVAWLLAGRLVDPWASPIAGVGVGVGTALVVTTSPARRVQRDVRAVEGGFDDVLSLVGRHVADGDALEVALERAGEEVTGPAGDLLSEAVALQRRLGVGVRDAFFGPHGVLESVPSARLDGAAALLSLAASEGRPAGAALVAMADHHAELRRLERDARHELASLTDTLGHTAALYAPLVGGVTVALSGRVGRTALASGDVAASSVGAVPSTALGVATLGPVVGVYVLALATVLSVLQTGLTRGLDPTLLGYRVGVALVAATATYLASVVGGGLLV